MMHEMGLKRKLLLLVIVTGIFLPYQACNRSSFNLTVRDDLSSLGVDVPESVIQGKALYDQRCQTCHVDLNGLPAKQGRTVDDIESAIRSISSMATPSLTSLRRAELQAIADYLNYKPACTPNSSPKRVAARNLSNDEYDNSISDLFSVNNSSSTHKFDSLPPGASGFSNDVNHVEITPLMLEKYWNSAVSIADNVIASKSQPNSAFSRIASCAVGQSSVSAACIDSIIRNFGFKVWRRPLNESTSNNEFTRLRSLFTSSSSFDEGLKNMIKALLISPNFLMVVIPNPAGVPVGQSFQLNQYQLASRLSFFLWQTTPDDELLNLARNGSLANSTVLQAQVQRMLRNGRAQRIAKVLTNEWLNLKRLPNLGITAIDAGTINSMLLETELMFQDIITNDLSLSRALTADYSFLNQTLANYYGVPFLGSDPGRFYKTSLASTPRRGVLGQAAFLVATSGSSVETHPVMRGKEVATRIACFEIGPPPPEAAQTPTPNLPPNATPREVLAIHTMQTQCAGCHKTLDPYGLAFEPFDTRGQLRTMYSDINRPVDQYGTLPTGESFQSVGEFMNLIGASPKVKACVTRKVLSYAVARNANTADDNCASESLSAAAMNPNSKFSDLILEIIKTKQFSTQTVE